MSERTRGVPQTERHLSSVLAGDVHDAPQKATYSTPETCSITLLGSKPTSQQPGDRCPMHDW
jgi:hypothetical protein